MSRRPATIADVRDRRQLFWARFAKAASNSRPGSPIGSYDWRHEKQHACQSGVMVQPVGHAWWDLGWFEVEE